MIDRDHDDSIDELDDEKDDEAKKNLHRIMRHSFKNNKRSVIMQMKCRDK